ncbi:condensation domain-containing protein [Neptunicoccus cionae]|uniref:Carrier domain-containing protein n=1 Tax=Neptunicoccus cionae TaxID=2035344 RepID=A0A916VMR2_9RHOB|nr:condensation domain-containing protein [Amylibacter cionae]GGA09770.1 hypothetical protein GCM10011498_07270 [Amylibacter cionae]
MNVINSQFDPEQVVAEFPLSTTQQQFWFLDQIHPGNLALNVAVNWEVQGVVCATSLERAYRLVIARHEVLRTRFVEKDGAPVQQVLDHADFDLEVRDITDLRGSAQEARLAEIAAEVSRYPFDLSNTGLIRATLVMTGPDRARLMTVVHHSIYDGYSIGVMGREIGTSAAAFAAGKTPDLPDLPLQYGDFSLWQRQYLASGVLDEDTAYWREQMKDALYFEVPTDFPRPKARNTEISYLNVALQDDFAEAIDRVAKANKTSPFVVGAAVTSAALHRVTGAEEVLFGTPIAGRQDVELEPLIGPFINHQVLRLPTRASDSLKTHIAQTKTVVEGALVHQNLPFSKLVEVVNPVRDASRAPLISMNFKLQHVFMEDETYGAFAMVSKPTFTPGAARDLDIVIMGRPSGWRLNIEYAPNLYKPETIKALLEMIKQSFAHVFETGNLTLGSLPLVQAKAPAKKSAQASDDPIALALQSHPFVANAVTVQQTRGHWGYVTANPSPLMALETLPQILMQHLCDQGVGTPLAGISVLTALPDDPATLPATGQVVALPAKPAKPANPQGDLEQGIMSIWQELLEHRTIPTDRSFFELGGHSLLAVRMVARIRKEWNVSLGVAAIYETPTIKELVAHLAPQIAPSAEAVETDWRVEPIRTDGEGQQIIAINDISLILNASEHFSESRPSVCVRLFDGQRGIDQSERSFLEIAAEYAKVIEAHQPQGPYLLFGACVHGNIALEAARHLQAKGHEIAGVVIKDCWEPGYAAGIHADKTQRRREKLYALGNRMRQVRKKRMSLAAMLGSYRIVRKSGVLTLATRLGLMDRVRATDMTAEQEGFVEYISQARNVYRPEPLGFPILHVVTRITPTSKGFLPSIGWEKIAGANLRTVSIDDVSVVKGQISGTDELAQQIEGFLAR